MNLAVYLIGFSKWPRRTKGLTERCDQGAEPLPETSLQTNRRSHIPQVCVQE